MTSIGVQTVAKVPLFRAGADASDIPFSIPLYEPVTEHERAMAAVFTKALELGRQVAVEYRGSRFFGDHRVPVSVHLICAGAGGARAGGHVRWGVQGSAWAGRRRW